MSRGHYLATQSKIYALMQERADADGIVRGMSFSTITAATGIAGSNLSPAINHLIDAGRLTRLADGRGTRAAVYWLGGTAKVPGMVGYEPCGIESVTWIMPNRNSLGSTGPRFVEISLPRLRCLETVE